MAPQSPRGGQWPSPSGELESRERTDLTSFSLLPTGQLPPDSRSPRGTFSLRLFPVRHLPGQSRELPPGLAHQDPGRCSWVVRGPAGGEGRRQGSQGTFPRKAASPCLREQLLGAPPTPHPSACLHVHIHVPVHEQCVFWWSPGTSWGLQGPAQLDKISCSLDSAVWKSWLWIFAKPSRVLLLLHKTLTQN